MNEINLRINKVIYFGPRKRGNTPERVIVANVNIKCPFYHFPQYKFIYLSLRSGGE